MNPIANLRIHFPMLSRRLSRTALLAAVLVGTGAAQPSASAQADPKLLNVNDVSFLWPVPKTKARADALISLADVAADGPIVPPEIFTALMNAAKNVKVGSVGIRFNDSRFDEPKTWKVAGIRFNPTALGSHPEMLARAEVPGVRLIVQPVLVDGNVARPQDFAAHVVFNYVLPPQPQQPIKPDKEAFGKIVKALRELKASLNLPSDPDSEKLQVHPGFFPDAGPLTAKLKELLRTHMSKEHLDRKQVAAISFMGIPGAFEPWIFFKVEADTASNTVTQLAVSGSFEPTKPTSQMISFFPDTNGKAIPTPLQAQNLPEVSTSILFPLLPANRHDEALFPGTTNPKLDRFQLRDVMDIVANPRMTTTVSTDCVSCHTESTRRHAMGAPSSQPGTAFVVPTGIAGVAGQVLPTDRWNVRNFGWGFNFESSNVTTKGFQATVSQRAANEAAESAAFINQNYPAP